MLRAVGYFLPPPGTTCSQCLVPFAVFGPPSRESEHREGYRFWGSFWTDAASEMHTSASQNGKATPAQSSTQFKLGEDSPQRQHGAVFGWSLFVLVCVVVFGWSLFVLLLFCCLLSLRRLLLSPSLSSLLSSLLLSSASFLSLFHCCCCSCSRLTPCTIALVVSAWKWSIP